MEISGGRGEDYKKHGIAKNEISPNNDFIIFFSYEYHVKSKETILNFAGAVCGLQVLASPLGWYSLWRLS